MYGSLLGLIDVNVSDSFTFANRDSRGHNNKLLRDRYRINICLYHSVKRVNSVRRNKFIVHSVRTVVDLEEIDYVTVVVRGTVPI